MARALATSLLLWLLLAHGAPPVRAHIVSDKEVVLLQRLPAGLVSGLSRPHRPDSMGCVGPNRGAWKDVAFQRGAMLVLADAAARADSSEAERAWRAIDVAFTHQQPSGGFESSRSARMDDPRLGELSSATAWISELCRAIVVVNNSPLAPRFRWRWTLLLPKLRRSMEWLATGAREVQRGRAADADLLLAQAQAFLLGDGLYHEPRYNQLGVEALVAGLALQRSDGAFLVDGYVTPGASARCLMRLQEIAMYYPSPSLDEAVDRGAGWLARQVHGNGEIQSVRRSDREVVREVVISLAYHAQRKSDPAARRAADRAYAFIAGK